MPTAARHRRARPRTLDDTQDELHVQLGQVLDQDVLHELNQQAWLDDLIETPRGRTQHATSPSPSRVGGLRSTVVAGPLRPPTRALPQRWPDSTGASHSCQLLCSGRARRRRPRRGRRCRRTDACRGRTLTQTAQTASARTRPLGKRRAARGRGRGEGARVSHSPHAKATQRPRTHRLPRR